MQYIVQYLWLIPALPLAAAGLGALLKRDQRRWAASMAIGGMALSFVSSCIAFLTSLDGHPFRETWNFQWFDLANTSVQLGWVLDPLTAIMLVMVTFLALLILIYSLGYMAHDENFTRFFCFMSLFGAAMLGIVIANSLLLLFICWELVGLSSYLLIGFWFEKPSAADAAKKAFFTNRLGDFGFLIGILVVWATLGSLNFSHLESIMSQNSAALGAVATAAGLLVFCGAMGKSAQFPLHVWLPDAMEGPTPVSALIHAATMVAAGVYMLCRILFLLTPSPVALAVIAYIGGITALLSATIAFQQNDIKRIIAYSTLSQLGYMVMAVGLAGPTPAMFHLTTHAFFKALLFLSAGSVILGMHHEQDIWQMGNLRRKMPITFWTFLIGALALSGVPPFSGFYSKDSILGQALGQAHDHPAVGYPLFAVGVLVAGMTTFYIFRLFFVVFFGKEKSDVAAHAHESTLVITLPLLVLAVFSAIGGFIGVANNYGSQFMAGQETLSVAQQIAEPFHNPGPMLGGLGAVAIGFFFAYSLYKNAASDPLPAKLGWLAKAMKNKFYFDEIYEATFIRFHDIIAAVMDKIDRWIVEGFCIGIIRGGTDLTGRALRLLQTGNLQTYAFLFVLGVAVVLYFVLVK